MNVGTLEIQLMANVARLMQDMSDAQRGVTSAMKSIEDTVKGAMGVIAGALTIDAFAGFIKDAVDAAASLKDLGKQSGIAVEQLSGLKFAAEQSGGGFEGIVKSINKLSMEMGKDAEKFAKIGVTAKEPLEAFKQFADVFKSIENPQLRAAVASEALSKSWESSAVLLSNGGKEIGELVKKGMELSGVNKKLADDSDEFNSKLAEMGSVTKGIASRIASELLPVMNEFLGQLLSGRGPAMTFTQIVKELVEKGQIRAWAQAAADGIRALMAAIVPAAKVAAVWFGLFVAAPAIFAAVVPWLTAAGTGIAMIAYNWAIGQSAGIGFNTVLFGTSVSAELAAGSLSKMRLAMLTLFAAFAGWQIGSYLRDQFVEARVAGLAFVAALMTGWENLKYAGQLTWEAIQFAFDKALGVMQTALGGWLLIAAQSLSKLPGFGDISTSVQEYADKMINAGTSTKSFEERTAGLAKAHEAAKAAIEQQTQDLVNYELATANAASTASESESNVAKVREEALENFIKGKKAESEYSKLIKKLDEEIAKGLAELEAAQHGYNKAQADFVQLARSDVWAKMTSAERASVTAKFEKRIATEKLVDAEKKQLEIEKELAALDEQRVARGLEIHQKKLEEYDAAVKASEDALKAAQDEYEQYGLSKSEIAKLTLAQLELNKAKSMAGVDFEYYNAEAVAIQKQIESQEKIVAIIRKGEVRQLMEDQARDAANVWRDAGADIADALERAFGSGGTAIGKFVKSFTDGTARQVELERKFAKDKKDNIGDLATLQKKFDTDSTRNALQMYGNMAGAAAGFFDEQSRGYQTLMAVSKAFHIAEIAMQMAEMVPKGINAILNQGNGDPYTAFARMAAMAAIVGALVGGVGGGGGGGGGPGAEANQRRQGTGTVLGDEGAKSESIANAIEILSKNSDVLNMQANAMINALLAIRDNLSGIAALVSQSAGLRATAADEKAVGVGSSPGFLGIGASSRTITDSGIVVTPGQTVGSASAGGLKGQGFIDINEKNSGLWGLFSSDSTRRQLSELDKELQKQLGKTIEQMRNGVLTAASVLGIGGQSVIDKLNAMSIDIGDISFKGLTGEEVEKELQAVFSRVGDQMAKEIMPTLGPFQKVGEGMFETLVRVASGITEANSVLRQFNITAIDYTAIMNKQGDVASEIVRQSIMAIEGARYTTSAGYFTEEIQKEKVTTQEWQQVDVGEGFATMLVAIETEVDKVVKVWHDGTTTLTGELTGVGQIMANLPSSMSAEDMAAVYETLLNLRHGLDIVGLGAIDLDANFIRAAGGMEKLQTGLDTFADKFFTSTEKNRRALSEMEETLGAWMPKTRTEWRKMIEGLEEAEKILPGMNEAQKANANAAKQLLGALLGLTPGVDEAFAAIEDFADRAGISASGIAASIQDGLLGKISAADLGGELSNVVVGGVYNAIAGGAADQITGMIMDTLVTPIMTDILSGSTATAAISAHLTKANIDGMISSATAAVDAMTQIFNNPDFIEAMNKLKAAMQSVASAIVPSRQTPYFTPYVPPEAAKTGTSGTTAATETAKALPTHALEIELLRLQGKALEALNLQRQDELQSLSESDKALKLQIYALQDAAALRKLNSDLLAAEGRTYEAMLMTRAETLRTLNEEQYALQTRIYQAQDRAKTEALQVQIATLLGDSTAALAATRAKELAALSPTDRALQEHIYQLQDQAEAAKKATAAMAEITRQMDQVANLKSSIQQSIQSIRPDTAAALASAQAAMAKAMGGSIEERIKAAGGLQEAIMAHHQEQMSAAQTLRQEQSAAAQEAIAAQNQLNAAYRKLGDYAQSLLVGNLSALSPEEKLAQARGQYQSALAAAQAGDAKAAEALQGFAQTYLEQSRGYFASNMDYVRIFTEVQGAMAGLGGMAGPEQVFQENTAAWQSQLSTIQTGALEQLTSLSNLTDVWQAELQANMEEQAIAFTELGLNTAQVAANTDGLDVRIGQAVAEALAARDRSAEELLALIRKEINEQTQAMANLAEASAEANEKAVEKQTSALSGAITTDTTAVTARR